MVIEKDDLNRRWFIISNKMHNCGEMDVDDIGFSRSWDLIKH